MLIIIHHKRKTHLLMRYVGVFPIIIRQVKNMLFFYKMRNSCEREIRKKNLGPRHSLRKISFRREHYKQKLKTGKLIPFSFSIHTIFLENVYIPQFGNVWISSVLIMVYLSGTKLPVAHVILPCPSGL